MKKKFSAVDIPATEQLEAELAREKYKKRYHSVLRSTVYTLIIVAAVAVLTATLWLPVLQIYGSSMTPTLQDGEIVFSVKPRAKTTVPRLECSPSDISGISSSTTTYIIAPAAKLRQ